MKLNKRKIRILLASIVILTTLSFVLCYFTTTSLAFEYRLNPNGDYTRYDSAPSLLSCQDMLSTLSLQINMGFTQQGRYIKIICFTPGYGIFAFLSNSEDVSVTVSNSGDSITFDFTNSRHYQYGWNENFGFTYVQQPTRFTSASTNIIFSEITVPATSIPSFTGLNTNFNFGTQYINSLDVYNYYYNINYTLQNLESIKQHEYDNGYESGYDSGYDIGHEYGYESGYESGYDSGYDIGHEYGYESGYESGYNSGYQLGYNYGLDVGAESGYQIGYDEGESIGYDTGYNEGLNKGISIGYNSGLYDGYDSGYEDGYTEGYDDGYAAAEPGTEIVTEIIYRDAIEIDVGNVISGVGSVPKSIINTAFDIDIFGINIAGLLAALIIIVVTIFVIKKLKA